MKTLISAGIILAVGIAVAFGQGKVDLDRLDEKSVDTSRHNYRVGDMNGLNLLRRPQLSWFNFGRQRTG